MGHLATGGILRSLQPSAAESQQDDGLAGIADAAPAFGGAPVPAGRNRLVFAAMGAAAGNGVALVPALEDAATAVAAGGFRDRVHLHGVVAPPCRAGAGLRAAAVSAGGMADGHA